MPNTDPIAKALYQREYWAKNKAKILAARRARLQNPEKRQKKQQKEYLEYHENRAKHNARQTRKNRRRGILPRIMEGELPSIIVPAGRKWRTFENLIYFSTVKGYTEDEVLEILEAFRTMRSSQEEALEKKARAAAKEATTPVAKKATRKTATKS